MICSIEYHFEGAKVIIRFNKSINSYEKYLGSKDGYQPTIIFYYKSSKEEALKGIQPVTIEYSNTPRLQISADKFLYPKS